MKLTIVDASVAIKWFVDEKNAEEAIKILDLLEKNPTFFAVPELFFNEMLSVFCKISSSENQVLTYLKNLQELGLQRIENGSELLFLAAKIAIKYRLSGYDAIYAASAKLTSGVWLTADQKAHEKIKELEISTVLKG